MVSISPRQCNKFVEWIVFFLLILTISNTAQICFVQTFKFGVVALLVTISFVLRKKIDPVLLYILIYWLIINAIYSFAFSQPFSINKIIGYFLPVAIAYFSMKIIGASFWEKFEKWLFVLTAISIIMYIGNVLLPGVYDSLSAVFGRYIADFYTEARPTSWYAFVYTHSPIEDFDYIRNAGFMWEAGAFAMMALIAFIYRFCKNDMRLDLHCYIYIVAIVTTFSSAGYLALMLFFVCYFISKRNIWSTALLLVLIFVCIPYIYQLEFMSEKFEEYTSNANLNAASYNERLEMFEYNRFLVFEINMKRLLEWPFGYGTHNITDFSGMKFVGVNGIAIFSRMWGACGLLFLLSGIYKTIKRFSPNAKNITSTFMLFAILIMFFSNPIESSAIPWLYCFTPFIYKYNKVI